MLRHNLLLTVYWFSTSLLSNIRILSWASSSWLARISRSSLMANRRLSTSFLRSVSRLICNISWSWTKSVINQLWISQSSKICLFSSPLQQNNKQKLFYGHFYANWKTKWAKQPPKVEPKLNIEHPSGLIGKWTSSQNSVTNCSGNLDNGTTLLTP